MINFEFSETPRPDARLIRLDASALKRSYCETAFQLTLSGLRAKHVDPVLTVGTAVHKFVAARWEPAGELAAMAAGAEIYKTVDVDTAKFAAICSSFPRGLTPPPFSAPGYPRGVEFYFEAPWLEYVWKGHVYHIVVCGTIDLLTFSNGTVGIYDYKTTRKYKLEEAIAGYDKDMQFLFYRWAIWQFGHRFLPLKVYNAARENKLVSHVVIVQLGTANKPTRWTVGPAERGNPAEFEQFEGELKERLAALLSAPEGARAGWVSNQCPRCPYKPLCHALPGMEDAARAMQFTQKEYKPQEHT